LQQQFLRQAKSYTCGLAIASVLTNGKEVKGMKIGGIIAIAAGVGAIVALGAVILLKKKHKELCDWNDEFEDFEDDFSDIIGKKASCGCDDDDCDCDVPITNSTSSTSSASSDTSSTSSFYDTSFGTSSSVD
jgi:hypothetical protein